MLYICQDLYIELLFGHTRWGEKGRKGEGLGPADGLHVGLCWLDLNITMRCAVVPQSLRQANPPLVKLSSDDGQPAANN